MESPGQQCAFKLDNEDLMQNLSSVGWEGCAFSDIKVTLRGHSFNLHRLIISRCPYFNTLFTGSWEDSKKNDIHIRADDPLVTADAFRGVIGTLYSRTLTIVDGNVREVFATSSYFGMTEISKQCVDFIDLRLSPNNIISLINFARSCQYELSKGIADRCEAYLCQHAFRHKAMHAKFWEVQLFMVVNVLKSDLLWIPSEYQRYCFAKEVMVKKMAEEDEEDDDYQSVTDSAADISDIGGAESSSEVTVFYPYEKKDSGLYPVVQFPRPISDPPYEPSISSDADSSSRSFHRGTASSMGARNQSNGKVVESAILEVLKSGISYAHITHDVVLDILRDVNGMQNKDISDAFCRGMSQAHLFQLLTEKVGSGQHVLVGLALGDDLPPPFRFSVQFKNVANASERWPSCSDKHFYGGAWWWLSCWRVNCKDRNVGAWGGDAYHRICLHRDNNVKNYRKSPFRDPREKASVQYQFHCRDISCTGTVQISKAVGHPDAISSATLEGYVTEESLFFTAIIQLVF